MMNEDQEFLAGIGQELDQFDRIHALMELSNRFPGQVAFSTSLGMEDQVITDMICEHQIDIRIFTLDTGRLFPETYEIIDRTRARYDIKIEVFFPDAEEVEAYASTVGVNGFYKSVENRKQCCQIRKLNPLRRALKDVKVWVTGLRAEQSPFRTQMSDIEWDSQFECIKFHPIFHWKEKDVREYLKENKVPYNPLHDKGFPSIGCQPCTRAIGPGEDFRAGRWWWEQSAKECGLHAN